jgi:hypothetical protein
MGLILFSRWRLLELSESPNGSSKAEGENLTLSATTKSSQLLTGPESINQWYQKMAFPSMWMEPMVIFWFSIFGLKKRIIGLWDSN